MPSSNPEHPESSTLGNQEVIAAIAETNKLLRDLVKEIPQVAKAAGGQSEGGSSNLPSIYTGTFPVNQRFKNAGDLIRDVGKEVSGRVGGLSPSASTPFGIFGHVADKFHQYGAYSGKAEKYADVINQGVIQPAFKMGAAATGLNQIGEAQGVSGMAGDIGAGPFGARLPFNPAFNRGVQMKFQAFTDSMQGGITMAQAENIQKMTVNAGYKYGTSQYNQMRDTLQQTTKINSLIGQDAQTAALYDRYTRSGGASQTDFVASIKELNDTIQTTNVSVAQAMQDAIGYTNLIAKTGGNPAKGIDVSTTMQRITGLSGQATLALQNNGYVQAMQMQGTGLMPWQLGLMDPSQRAKLTMQSVNRLSKQLGPVPKDKVSTDEFGFKHVTSGQDQQDATMAMMMGVDINQIKNMRKNYRKDMKYGSISRGFEGYEQSAARIRDSHMSEYEKQRQLQQLNNQFGGKGTLGSLTEQMRKAGFSQKEIDKVMSAGDKIKGDKASDLASKASLQGEAYRKIMGEKTGKQQGPADKNKVMVGLTNDAKKYLTIAGQDSGKTHAGAGIGTVVGGVIGLAVGGGNPIGAMVGASLGNAAGGVLDEL